MTPNFEYKFDLKKVVAVVDNNVYQYVCVCMFRVTTCLENLEMLGNLKHVREMSGKKSCQGKVSPNCSLLVEYLHSSPFFSAHFARRLVLPYF